MTGRTRQKVRVIFRGLPATGRGGAGSEAGPAGGAVCPTSGEGKTGRGLSPLAFALAHALTLEDAGARFPLPVRLAWASALRRVDMGPGVLAKGAEEAHFRGLMHAGRLTPEGVRAGLLALSEDLTPPLLEEGPEEGEDPARAGQGGRHGRR
ncbi:MAG: hypothetical protein Q4C89_01400 [Deinococcus sp.]|uniref:hypothetical protein n=1 Tax=Deinococcus sp. TaxID=47478 RepID=UPI0026DCCABD|nr:hypothetical protein [Deinococcus sp.]MDO4244664.1 hypothetical protein [Deinococcus sp.]